MKRKFLEEFGLEKDVIDKIMAEAGSDIEAEKKKTSHAEEERDSLKAQLETAQNTLKGFEGMDPATITATINEYKQAAENAKAEYEKKITERDFNDTLTAAMSSVKFTSEAAKKAVIAEIREAGLTFKDGKILGLTDLLDQIKERDSDAFVDEEEDDLEKKKAKFTDPSGKGGQGDGEDPKKPSMSKLMQMKNADPSLDISKYM